jgi:hypothetical protein
MVVEIVAIRTLLEPEEHEQRLVASFRGRYRRLPVLEFPIDGRLGEGGRNNQEQQSRQQQAGGEHGTPWRGE